MGSDERTNAGGDTGDTGTELSCRELVDLVTAYREGALAPDARAHFEAHLASCPPCVHYVELESFTQELLKLFRAWKAETGRPAGE